MQTFLTILHWVSLIIVFLVTVFTTLTAGLYFEQRARIKHRDEDKMFLNDIAGGLALAEMAYTKLKQLQPISATRPKSELHEYLWWLARGCALTSNGFAALQRKRYRSLWLIQEQFKVMGHGTLVFPNEVLNGKWTYTLPILLDQGKAKMKEVATLMGVEIPTFPEIEEKMRS